MQLHSQWQPRHSTNQIEAVADLQRHRFTVAIHSGKQVEHCQHGNKRGSSSREVTGVFNHHSIAVLFNEILNVLNDLRALKPRGTLVSW
jgi:hypothetical protein